MAPQSSSLPALWFWFPLLSLVVAAIAVFFGPLIQLFIAKAQIRASVLSANRQTWINELREQIAAFIILAMDLKAHFEFELFDRPTFLQKLSEMRLRYITVNLMLNPKEADHRRLVELLQNAIDVGRKGVEPEKMNVPGIVELSQTILKREWERVKATK